MGLRLKLAYVTPRQQTKLRYFEVASVQVRVQCSQQYLCTASMPVIPSTRRCVCRGGGGGGETAGGQCPSPWVDTLDAINPTILYLSGPPRYLGVHVAIVLQTSHVTCSTFLLSLPSVKRAT